MPEEQVRRGGRYVAAKPGDEPQRVEAHIDPKAKNLGDAKNHNKGHHEYPAPPAPKPAPESAAAADKKEGA
jgi:hypothetical protein